MQHYIFYMLIPSYNPSDPSEKLMWSRHQISTGVKNSTKSKSPMVFFSFRTGGLICLTKTQHTTDTTEATPAVERELQRLEKEGVWTCVTIKKSDRYIKDTAMIEKEDNEGFISGTVYLYRKPLIWSSIMWISNLMKCFLFVFLCKNVESNFPEETKWKTEMLVEYL